MLAAMPLRGFPSPGSPAFSQGTWRSPQLAALPYVLHPLSAAQDQGKREIDSIPHLGLLFVLRGVARRLGGTDRAHSF
jgi:hypothetical protein